MGFNSAFKWLKRKARQNCSFCNLATYLGTPLSLLVKKVLVLVSKHENAMM